MSVSSHQTFFQFDSDAGVSFTGRLTSISIEEAQHEVVDMTDIDDPLGGRRIMATGDVLSPAKIAIEFMTTATNLAQFPPANMTGGRTQVEGVLYISKGSWYIEERAVLDSASTDMAVGDVIRGKMSFTISRIN